MKKNKVNVDAMMSDIKEKMADLKKSIIEANLSKEDRKDLAGQIQKVIKELSPAKV